MRVLRNLGVTMGTVTVLKIWTWGVSLIRQEWVAFSDNNVPSQEFSCMWWRMLLAVSSSSYRLSSCGSYPTRSSPRYHEHCYRHILFSGREGGGSFCWSARRPKPVDQVIISPLLKKWPENTNVSHIYCSHFWPINMVDILTRSILLILPDQSICQICWSDSINMAGMLTPGFHWCWFYWSSSLSGLFSSSLPLFCFRFNFTWVAYLFLI